MHIINNIFKSLGNSLAENWNIVINRVDAKRMRVEITIK